MAANLDDLIRTWYAADDERRHNALLKLAGSEDPEPDPGPLLFRMGDAAKFLGISRTSLWRLIKIGRLEKVELYPGSFRVRRADLLALVGKKGGNHE